MAATGPLGTGPEESGSSRTGDLTCVKLQSARQFEAAHVFQRQLVMLKKTHLRYRPLSDHQYTHAQVVAMRVI